MSAIIDISHELCPMTWVKVKLSLEQLKAGETLEVLGLGEEPLRNVPKSATEEGHRVLSTEAKADGAFRLIIEKRPVMARIRIPTPLRTYTQNQGEVKVQGKTVGEALKALEVAAPGIGARLFDEKGGLRRYVNIFHNDEDVRFLQQLDTPVQDSDTLSIIPAIAGGSAC